MLLPVIVFLLHLSSLIKIVVFAGAGFASKSTYIFGKANVQIKLIPEDSAGTVTAFYVTVICHTLDQFILHFLASLLFFINDSIYTW